MGLDGCGSNEFIVFSSLRRLFFTGVGGGGGAHAIQTMGKVAMAIASVYMPESRGQPAAAITSDGD